MRSILVACMLALVSASACRSWASSKIAGTIAIPAHGVRTLELRSPEPKSITVEVWNRGPGLVTFRSLDADGHSVMSMVLAASSDELRLAATSDLVRIELTAEATEATVGFVVQGRGSLSSEISDPAKPAAPAPATPAPPK